MRLHKYTLALLLLASSILFAQEVETPAPSNLDKLLELVKEGKTQEQAENADREARFIRSRNQQQEILREEQRELARQERIADELEEVFAQNQEKLRVAEEAYLKQLGSLNELFGHMQSISTDSRVHLRPHLLQQNLVKTESFSLVILPERWANQQNFQQSKKSREFGMKS